MSSPTMTSSTTSAVVLVMLMAALTSSTLAAMANYTRPAGTCGYPGNNANSMTNFTGNWVSPRTVVTYACDAGFRLFGNGEHRTCRHDGTWTAEAPICAQQVSVGKNISCTSDSCRSHDNIDSNSVVHMVDDNDDTCMTVRSTRVADVTRFRLDLLELFEVRLFRFVFRGKTAQYTNPRIVLENEHHAESELLPSECIINKETLQPKGDGYALIIRPYIPRWARYVNIYINHHDPNEEINFCELQAYSDNAPSYHQCSTSNTMQDASGSPVTSVTHPGAPGPKGWSSTSSTGTVLGNTIVHRGQCYTFDSNAAEWPVHRERCRTVHQGELIHDVTEDINRTLTSYVQVKGSITSYWMGASTDKRPTPTGRPDYVLVWISGNQIYNPLLEPKPDHCLAFAAPKGIWMLFPCYYKTGSICQSPIKRCGSLPLSEHMTASQPWRTEIGVTNVHRCPSGYGLVGSESRVCQPDGRWSGIAPTCIFGGANQDKFSMTALIGIGVGILIALILILLVLFIFLRKQGVFRHKMNIGGQKSDSIEALECGDKKDGDKKERSSLNATAAGTGVQNYDTLGQEPERTYKR